MENCGLVWVRKRERKRDYWVVVAITSKPRALALFALHFQPHMKVSRHKESYPGFFENEKLLRLYARYDVTLLSMEKI